mgnify:CR=1 FL=1
MLSATEEFKNTLSIGLIETSSCSKLSILPPIVKKLSMYIYKGYNDTNIHIHTYTHTHKLVTEIIH